jgi:hypothetical protein
MHHQKTAGVGSAGNPGQHAAQLQIGGWRAVVTE